MPIDWPPDWRLDLQNEEGTLTAPGWPRPWIAGIPIPWVSSPYEMGKTDGDRREWTKHERGCQVCGEKHEPGAEVVAFLAGPLVSLEDDEKELVFPNLKVMAMDDAILHERCARLAAKHCPKLKEMHAEGSLFAFAAPVERVRDNDELTIWGIVRRLWLPGRHVRIVEI